MNEPTRREHKFRLPLDALPLVRELIEPHTILDPHGQDRENHLYTVRSIYFDTADLRFYFEKVDKFRNRRKLRVRTYDAPSDGHSAFIEIKYKMGPLGRKDRLELGLAQVPVALNGGDSGALLDGLDDGDRKIYSDIRELVVGLGLQPVVLISYEREAYVGRECPRQRVTFDRNLRSLIRPGIDQIFAEQELVVFEDRRFVMELKYDYDGDTPAWMVALVNRLGLSTRRYSKYCRGIDAWTGRPHPSPLPSVRRPGSLPGRPPGASTLRR